MRRRCVSSFVAALMNRTIHVLRSLRRQVDGRNVDLRSPSWRTVSLINCTIGSARTVPKSRQTQISKNGATRLSPSSLVSTVPGKRFLLKDALPGANHIHDRQDAGGHHDDQISPSAAINATLNQRQFADEAIERRNTGQGQPADQHEPAEHSAATCCRFR